MGIGWNRKQESSKDLRFMDVDSEICHSKQRLRTLPLTSKDLVSAPLKNVEEICRVSQAMQMWRQWVSRDGV